MHKALAGVAGYFIPKADAARKLLHKPKTDAPLLSMIPIVVVKKDGHPVAHIGSLDEDEDGRVHKQLDQPIGFYQPFLMHTLSKLRERYSPNVDQIVEFLYLKWSERTGGTVPRVFVWPRFSGEQIGSGVGLI